MTAELNANFQSFETRWKAQWQSAETYLSGDQVFSSAFRRLVSMQAWRSEMFENAMTNDVAQFVLEGQNDLLTAYIFARTGQWRPALQAQRAAIESYLSAFYFMDHNVELTLWSAGRFKTQFSDQIKYFASHPSIYPVGTRKAGIDIIKSEYATLSKAVHGSAKAFRMTKDGGPQYFSKNEAEKNKWVSRNRLVIRGLNLLSLALFHDEMVGTKKRNLRKAVCLALRLADKGWVKNVYGVTLPF